MRVSGWLKKIRDSEKGNALAIGAAVMPMLLGAAGLAVDTIQLSVWKRQLQRAADSSAIAGAYALTQSETPSEAVDRDLDQNFFPTLTQPEVVEVGPQAGFPQAVRVQLVSQRRLPFMSIFMHAPSTIQANAAAALVDDGRFCVLSLYNGAEAGIDIAGDADINLGCGMASNSRSSEAVVARGSSMLNASPIMAVGGLSGTRNNFADGTTLQPHSAEQSDPFASLPEPEAQSGCTPFNVQPGQTATRTPEQGCITAMDLKGTASFAPGVYYVTGDVSFGSQANVTGQGVTFILTGPGGQAGSFDMHGDATINLSAPTSGTYANVLFYRDRRSANEQVVINGGTNAVIQGALYFPTSDIRFAGHTGFQARCFQMVGQRMTFRGTGAINNTCPGQTDNPSFRLRYVRLVG